MTGHNGFRFIVLKPHCEKSDFSQQILGVIVVLDEVKDHLPELRVLADL